MKQFLVILIAASGIALTAPVAAEPGGPFGALGGFAHDLAWQQRMASELGLTEVQQSAIEKITDQSRDQAKPFIKLLFEQHKAMRALTDTETFDEAAVRAEQAKSNAAMTELAVIHARSAVAIRAVLSPSQREQLTKMHEHRRRPH